MTSFRSPIFAVGSAKVNDRCDQAKETLHTSVYSVPEFSSLLASVNISLVLDRFLQDWSNLKAVAQRSILEIERIAAYQIVL